MCFACTGRCCKSRTSRRPVLILSADLILFANMMNMITLKNKSVFATIVMLALCAAGGYLLFRAVKDGRGNA